MRMERTMTAATTRCICTHLRCDHHSTATNPRCLVVDGTNYYEPCDCPGFEADPKVNNQ